MKKFKLLLMASAILATGIFLNSCKSEKVVSSGFIQKRKYTKGFFVNLNDHKKEKAKASESLALNLGATTKKITPFSALVASPEITTTLAANSSQKGMNEKQNANTLVASSSSKQIAVKKSSIYKVATGYEADNYYTEFANEADQSTQNPLAMPSGGGGGKSWIAALLLCIFLGGIGIHRFYLGYTWQGVVQLLTGGGCGIWALIDLIRIIIRDLKPKDGDYKD